MTGGVVVDALLVGVLIWYAVSGYRQGLLVSALSLVGFLGGGALAMTVLPEVLRRWDWAQSHTTAARYLLVLVVFVLAALGQTVLVSVARRMRGHIHARPVQALDAALGALATVTAVSVLVWFVAGGMRGLASSSASKAIGESRVLAAIDSVVPPETGNLFAGFRQVLDRGGFPRVFEGLGTEPVIPVDPPSVDLARLPAVTAALDSVVKVTGIAAECRRGQEGSGFVVAPERVLTNAHVVSGLGEVTVQVRGAGPGLRGSVVHFDPARDLAVIAVPRLTAPALQLGAELGRSDDAVIAGFPLDGPLRVDEARVRDRILATGQDIYGHPGVTRQIYSLYARVESGNSGGPLLDTAGRVVGVVFAQSVDDEHTGYALTLEEARAALQAASSAQAPVPTGACISG